MHAGFDPERLSLSLFTETPPSAFEIGGGFGNAFVGTLTMVGIAALISVPFGILTACPPGRIRMRKQDRFGLQLGYRTKRKTCFVPVRVTRVVDNR